MAESTSTIQDSTLLDTNTMDPRLKASTQGLNLAETREIIMLHLDPLSLLNLISVNGLALATFKRYSTMFLNSTVAVLNADSSAGTIPIAILEALKTRPADEHVVDRNRQHVHLGLADEKRQTELEKFLDEFVRKGHWRFPDYVEQPLDSLRQLARIYKAVETLMNSRIWTCIGNFNIGINRPTVKVWFSKKEEMRRVLWIYQLYCTLYHRSGTNGCGEVLFPSNMSQSKYITILERQETDTFMRRLVSIYRDLSSFLAELHKEDWPRIFHDDYRYYSSLSQNLREGLPITGHQFVHRGFAKEIVSPEFWSDEKVVHDTHCDFYQYIGYEMSKGLPHLAQMYRLSLESKPSDYPVQKYWTNSFFTKAFKYLDYGEPDLCDSTQNKGYLLEPLEEGKNGYRLSIIVPATKGDYLVRGAKPLFADEEFKPTHLGNLTKKGDPGKGNTIRESLTSKSLSWKKHSLAEKRS